MPLPVKAEQVLAVWSALAGVEQLGELQVVPRPDSPLCPPGWLGLLALDGTLTVVVPDAEQVGAVRTALVGLTSAEATTPEIVVARFGGVAEVLGPAALFYPTAPLLDAPREEQCERAGLDELQVLLGEACSKESSESGLAEITVPAFVVREGSTVVAACGWRAWPGGVAHLCVLTRSTHRQRGLARRVAAQAIRGAAGEGLLPQWRARPAASHRLARSLGLVQLGAQLSLRLG